MHVLVAGVSTPHPRDDDFSFTVAGELVWVPLSCDCRGCGCERSVGGLASARATTIFHVFDHPSMTPEEYREAFRDSLTRQGWAGPVAMTPAEVDALANAHLAAAAEFPDGADLRRVGATVVERHPQVIG